MWYNAIMVGLLRSPLHGMLSQSTLAMTYTGRKSGKTYTTPMNYARVREAGGEVLLTTSFRQRAWWRNLRGGAPVGLSLLGKDVKGQAEVTETEPGVAEGLKQFLEAVPG
jgi:hypothetical protein